MAKLDYNIVMMPALIQTVAHLSSTHTAVRFARTFGGKRLYFPNRLYSANPIVRCLGPRVAERVCKTFLAETIVVPAATHYLRWIDARALLVVGLSRADIGAALGLSQRQVFRLVEGFDPAEIEVDRTVLEIARLYNVSRRTLSRVVVAQMNIRQRDFGWPADQRGAPVPFHR